MICKISKCVLFWGILCIPLFGQQPSSEADSYTFNQDRTIYMYGMQDMPVCTATVQIYRNWYWPWERHLRARGLDCAWQSSIGTQTQLDMEPQ